MPKPKKKSSQNSDTSVVAIILGLFAAVVILFFIFSKAKESNQENLVPVKSVSARIPPERSIPMIVHHQPIESEPEEETEAPAENEIRGAGAKIAIILDDWGQSMANCKYLHEIPEPMAISILPGLRHTKDIANCARINHKLTMLHLPLEALHNYDFYPPNYVIKTTMTPELVTQIVSGDLSQLPTIEGVNNHMGSKGTADKALMRVIFKIIRKKGLFFVDSMTSPHSISAALAGEMGLAYAKRDVFLDNVNTSEAITKQMQELARVARRHGYAIAIGHDRPVTMRVLKEEIPWLEKQGFQIVSIKDLLKNR